MSAHRSFCPSSARQYRSRQAVGVIESPARLSIRAGVPITSITSPRLKRYQRGRSRKPNPQIAPLRILYIEIARPGIGSKHDGDAIQKKPAFAPRARRLRPSAKRLSQSNGVCSAAVVSPDVPVVPAPTAGEAGGLEGGGRRLSGADCNCLNGVSTAFRLVDWPGTRT